MNIAIPVVIAENKVYSAHSFTECDSVCIHNQVSDETKLVSIDSLYGNKNKENLFEILKELNINSVIMSRIKPMAYRFFLSHNIDIYKHETSSVSDIIELYKQNLIPKFSSGDVSASSCAGSCTTCSTTCK